jgi:general secretion pathway protein D
LVSTFLEAAASDHQVALFRNLLMVLALTATAWSAEPAPAEARRLYRAAQQSEKKGDTLNAYLLYARAAALEPANLEYAFRKNALQAKAVLTAETRLEPDPALEPGNAAPNDAGNDASDDADELTPDPAANPGPDSARSPAAAPSTAALLAAGELSPAEISEAREALPPVHLADPGTHYSFDVVRDEPRSIIEQVTSAFGIRVVFDPDYQAPPPFTLHAQDLSLEEALRILEAVSNSLIVPVGEHAALVFRDSPQRRTDSLPTMSLGIPIPERLTVQDAQEILTAVQQTLELRKVSIDPGRHMVYIRDQVSKALAAKQLFAKLSRQRAQMEVEVELLSVSKNSSLAYGLSLPGTSQLVNFGGFLNNAGSAVATMTHYLAFGGGASLFGLGIADAAALATVSRGSSASVLRASVVTADGQPATLHIGDRYPIVTQGYYGPTTGTGQTYAPPPTVQFQDLGLSLKVTPSVHAGGEVTLDLEVQYAVLGATVTNGIPAIASRKFAGKVRLAEGEWAVVAGLAESDVGTTISGTLGAMRLPVIGRLLRQTTKSKDSSEVLIVLKPQLMNLPPWEFPTESLWIGSESTPLSLY